MERYEQKLAVIKQIEINSVLKHHGLEKRAITSASSNLHCTSIKIRAAHTLLNSNKCAEKIDKPRKLRKAVCLSFVVLNKIVRRANSC